MPEPDEVGEVTEENEEVEDGGEKIIKCALKGDVETFVQWVDDPENPFKETLVDLINERDEDGKSPLDLAATLGRADMVKELITRGADVNSLTCNGYSAMHRASTWGKIHCLKVLVENSGDLHQKNCHDEIPRDTAARYQQAECVDYLDWAEAKEALLKVILTMRETLADPEKVQGRLTRDDKNLSVNACNEKQEWLDNTLDATTQDFISQKQQLEETLDPIWIKLSEPLPEKPEKK